MHCAHCGGRLFQDMEDVDRWACILCGRSPQQEIWKSEAEQLLEHERLEYGRNRKKGNGRNLMNGTMYIRSGKVRLG